jgi:transposase
VYRVAHRFVQEGLVGLGDRREDNGEEKVTEDYELVLLTVLKGSPRRYHYPRPSWTQELLILVLEKETGIRISTTTMSRVLRRLGIRRRRPKPVVCCPWKKGRKTRRLNQIRRLVETVPKGEVVVYVDEVDVHLNPKIGPDWMLAGVRHNVLTPGRNAKGYLAGALNTKTGRLTWVESDSKNSDLFIKQLWALAKEDYPEAKCIHVILDNYRIHHSQRTQIAVKALAGKIKLHFLPPYCPNHNRIERVWKDLHDNVTRNHKCRTLEELIREVRRYLRKREKAMHHEYVKVKRRPVPESRKAA